MRTRCREVGPRRLRHAIEVDGVQGTALHPESDDGHSGRRRREERGIPPSRLHTGSTVPRPSIRCQCVIVIFAACRKEMLTGAVADTGRERVRPIARRRRRGRGRGWERSQAVCGRHSLGHRHLRAAAGTEPGHLTRGVCVQRGQSPVSSQRSRTLRQTDITDLSTYRNPQRPLHP